MHHSGSLCTQRQPGNKICKNKGKKETKRREILVGSGRCSACFGSRCIPSRPGKHREAEELEEPGGGAKRGTRQSAHHQGSLLQVCLGVGVSPGGCGWGGGTREPAHHQRSLLQVCWGAGVSSWGWGCAGRHKAICAPLGKPSTGVSGGWGQRFFRNAVTANSVCVCVCSCPSVCMFVGGRCVCLCLCACVYAFVRLHRAGVCLLGNNSVLLF